MKRRPPATAGPIRAEVLARRRRLVASRDSDVEEWERADAVARWLPPELEAGEPVVLRAAEVADWVPWVRPYLGDPQPPWFRLEADDSLTEVEAVPGTGGRLDNPVQWRPVGPSGRARV